MITLVAYMVLMLPQRYNGVVERNGFPNKYREVSTSLNLTVVIGDEKLHTYVYSFLCHDASIIFGYFRSSCLR